MEKKIKVYYSDNESEVTTVDINSVCPHCGIPIDPTVLSAHSNSLINKLSGSLCVLLSCTNPVCKKYHVQAFEYTRYAQGFSIEIGKKVPYTYKPILENNLPEEINNTFPNFATIYNQALEAESMALDQIAGVGFIKSIEFLIKEYVIHQNPNLSEEIKAKFLGKVINENLKEFPKIQTLAKAAVWIGNDETHFVRVHDDKDIQDMKEFLTAAALFISAELKVEEALEFTNRPKS